MRVRRVVGLGFLVLLAGPPRGSGAEDGGGLPEQPGVVPAEGAEDPVFGAEAEEPALPFARVDRLFLASVAGAPTSVRTGRRIGCVADHHVKVAESAADPVPREVEEPVSPARTPHGPVDAPRMALTSFRTSLRVPLGRTAVVGSAAWEGRSTLLLVTPTRARSE